MVGKYKALVLALLLIAATACGKTAQERAQQLLLKFEADAANYSLHVDTDVVEVIFMKQLPRKNVGECWLSNQKILLLQSWWNHASAAEQEVLMYHELGHCMLNRTHRDTHTGPLGFPSSIMYYQLLSGDVYRNNIG